MWPWDLQDCGHMPENGALLLSLVNDSYSGMNLKYELWPGMRILRDERNLV